MTLAAAALKVAIVALALVAVLRAVLSRRLARAMGQPRDEGGTAHAALETPADAGPMAAAARRLAADRPGLTGVAMLADGPAAFAARVALIDAARATLDASITSGMPTSPDRSCSMR